MRMRSQKQLYFKAQSMTVKGSEYLLSLNEVLEELPGLDNILQQIQSDLNPSNSTDPRGRNGMTAEQVLRALLLKQNESLPYRKLADRLGDSMSMLDFMKLCPYAKGFSYKTLQSNIKLLKEETLDLIMSSIKSYAMEQGIEDGKITRTDGFSTQANIHYPTDWNLMNDSIRVLSRTLCRAKEDLLIPVEFTNHYKSSKKKLFKINNDKSPTRRRKLNLELIRLTRNTLSYAKHSLVIMEEFQKGNSLDLKNGLYLGALIANLKAFMPLVEKVIDQAHRRIVKGEEVPSSEKLVSIFEEHTDIISKGKRDVIFGHKNTITTGRSGLILGVEVHEGNPADSTLVKAVIEDHKSFYGYPPESAVFDGCYSSNENRKFAKDEGITNVSFSKETDKQSSVSKKIRKKLRDFRAGIEATVSMLQRMFGLKRILNRSLQSFKATVKAATVTYNLFLLARLRLAT